MFFQLGYLKKAEEMRSRARAINERFGIPGFERWSLGEDVESFYQRGRWDEAATISKQWLEDLGPSGHYLEATVRVYRSQLSFARDDVGAAVQEGELSLQRARVVKDPQVLEPILAWWAFLTLKLGRHADAADSFDELLTEWGGVHCGYANGAVAPAWVAHALGRGPEVEPTLKPRAPMNLWANAALHIVRGEFTAAADIIDQIGSLPDAAYARLRAAHALVGAERRAEADEQLGRALTFYRSVGAARYVREAEALPAATA
jgi:tetratricopeptide (TPR) repeat protein